MADITFFCSSCGQKIEAELDWAGLSAECPNCNTTIIIPSNAPVSFSGANLADLPESSTKEGRKKQKRVIADETIVEHSQHHGNNVTCSNCGAQLEVDETNEIGTCLFCGSKTLLVTPEKRLQKLQDIDNPRLRVAYLQPRLSMDDACDLIRQKIAQDDCGVKDSDNIQMDAKGIFFPCWDVTVSARCNWAGENSHTVHFTNYRTVSNGRGGSHQEKFRDTRTEWRKDSGTKFFTETFNFRAAKGISIAQLGALASDPADAVKTKGIPKQSKQLNVIPAIRSQNDVWEQDDGVSCVDTHAKIVCGSCAERINDVSVLIKEREFALTYRPVAVVTYTVDDNDYRHFVNLQTGTFSGDVPLDINGVLNECHLANEAKNLLAAKKMALNVIGYLLLIAVGLFALAFFNGADLSDGLLLGLTCCFFVGMGLTCWASNIDPRDPWWGFVLGRQEFLLRLVIKPHPQLTETINESSDLLDKRDQIAKAIEDNDLDMPCFCEIAEQVACLLLALKSIPVGASSQFHVSNGKRPVVKRKHKVVALIVCVLVGTGIITGIVADYNSRRATEMAESQRNREAQWARDKEIKEQENAKKKAEITKNNPEQQKAKPQQDQIKRERSRNSDPDLKTTMSVQNSDAVNLLLERVRFNEPKFEVSYLPPKDWHRIRMSKDDMSLWMFGKVPEEGMLFFGLTTRNVEPQSGGLPSSVDTDSILKFIAQGSINISEDLAETTSPSNVRNGSRFVTNAGQNGVKTVPKVKEGVKAACSVTYYIAKGDSVLFVAFSAPVDKWTEWQAMSELCVNSVRFGDTSGTYQPAGLDSTPERNADLLDAEVLSNIGVTYFNDSNLPKAVLFFRQAADQGHALSQLNLGLCYMDGLGVIKDLSQAVNYFKAAGKQGLVGAQIKLGLCYYEGTGIDKNLMLAEKCFELAAQQGNKDAQTLLLRVQAERQNALATTRTENSSTVIRSGSSYDIFQRQSPSNREIAPQENQRTGFRTTDDRRKIMKRVGQ